MIEPLKSVGEILKKSLVEKRRKNPSYSARALARDLKVSASYLSMVLNSKKALSLDKALLVADSLAMKGKKRSQFLRAVAISNIANSSHGQEINRILLEPPSSQDFVSVDVDKFQLFNHWYHVALLDLVTCQNFKSDIHWIARRLGMVESRAADAIDRLLRLGLLVKDGKNIRKTNAELAIPTHNSVSAVRTFHAQMIEKAQEHLHLEDEHSFSMREVSGITMAINPNQMQEAKKRIALFKREMYELLAAEEVCATEVFQLNIQLFPLTKPSAGDKE